MKRLNINLICFLPSTTHPSVRYLLVMEILCVFINPILIQWRCYFMWTPTDYSHKGFLAKNQDTCPDFLILMFFMVYGYGTPFPHIAILFLWGFRITRAGLLLCSRVCSKCLMHLSSPGSQGKDPVLVLMLSSPFPCFTDGCVEAWKGHFAWGHELLHGESGFEPRPSSSGLCAPKHVAMLSLRWQSKAPQLAMILHLVSINWHSLDTFGCHNWRGTIGI